MQVLDGTVAEGVGDNRVGLVAQREPAWKELLDRLVERLVAVTHGITSTCVVRHREPCASRGSRTPVELLVDGIRAREPGMRVLLAREAVKRSRHC
ncbi:MAG: hypothetical protein KA191_08235 [Verrucomicrobia bacterium]|nr:hypothetical protein [Verrucomicrobiota bacterium]